MFRGASLKVLKWFAVLPGLTLGALAGLLLTLPLGRLAGDPGDPEAGTPLPDVARLAPAELEALALDVLTALHEKREADGESRWGKAGPDQRQIHRGIDNVRRLLPLGKQLTLRALKRNLKSSGLAREKQLIASVRRVVLDTGLGNAAAVSEDDLSVIYIGPGYAPYLTSDEEAMFVLGHELTHVAARGGRLGDYIERVGAVARGGAADLELNAVQKEELTCDFTGTQVLKRFMLLRPAARSKAERFSSALGYEPRSERLSRAWEDFCTSYNGDPADGEHLSQQQLFRILPRLDPELQALLPDDAIESRLCRQTHRR